MSLPPVPPRPYSAQGVSFSPQVPPPVPPIPPELKYESPPHFSDPIAAPRPHRVDPSVPANMARNLEEYPGINFTPGFAVPQQPNRGPSPLPPPQGANWSPWSGNMALNSSSPSLVQSMSFTPPQVSPYNFASSEPSLLPASQPATPSLTAPTPTIETLQPAMPNIQSPNYDPSLKIAWARDVITLVDKHINPSPSTDLPVGPAVISDPAILRLIKLAVPTVIQIASSNTQPVPPYVAEAIYLRATFAASGAYPEHIPHNPRVAFRDFESAARAGYATAWFRLGRDYENFNDISHARDCFERGVKLGVESCAYRMGMAHMMGQLGLQSNPSIALPLLHRAATLATVATPQPAYIYALLLLGEFASLPTPIPASAFTPFIPAGSSQVLEVRRHLERAAYLGFAPAQYKLGHAYEFAQPPFPFDPLLSVQYYSLASQQGEVEADMALSKWFLCGSGGGAGEDGGFEKDESLAYTFAEKAARKGLPSAEFAMGYYAEVGVGSPKDLQTAIQWYKQAQVHGNKDASERLAALSQPSPSALSRQQHDTITENKLVRKRTQAKQRSDSLRRDANNQNQISTLAPQQDYFVSQGSQNSYPAQQKIPQNMRPDGRAVVDNIRQSSLGYPGAQPVQNQSLTPAQQYQKQYQQQHPSPPLQQSGPQQDRHSTHSAAQPHPQHRPGSTPGVGRRPQSSGPGPNIGRGQQVAQHRYTLADAPGPGGANSPSAANGRQSPFRPGLGRAGAGAAVTRPNLASNQGGSTQPQGQVLDIGQNDPLSPNSVLSDEEDLEVTVGLGGGRVFAAKPNNGPATFAEMGFQGTKAEGKECVIM